MKNIRLNTFLIIQLVDANPETRGIGIYMTSDVSMQSSVLRPPQSPLIKSALIIEVNVVQKKMSTTSLVTKVKGEVFSEKTGALKPLYKELTTAGISCTTAVISGVGVVGGAAASVPSGGTSLVVSALSWTALITSSAQCINSAGRLGVAVYDRFQTGKTRSEIETLSELDSNRYYSGTMKTIDTVNSVASVTQLTMYMRNIPLRTDKFMLNSMKNMKGKTQLEVFRQRFSTSAFRNKQENEAILKMLDENRKGVGKRVIKKMLQANKQQLKDMSMKKFVVDVGNSLLDKTTDGLNFYGESEFEKNKTIEVNFHFIEVH